MLKLVVVRMVCVVDVTSWMLTLTVVVMRA